MGLRGRQTTAGADSKGCRPSTDTDYNTGGSPERWAKNVLLISAIGTVRKMKMDPLSHNEPKLKSDNLQA